MKTLTLVVAGLVGSLALAACGGSGGSGGDSFPTKSITLIVPSAAGGTFDETALLIKDGWGKRLGRNVLIKYVPAGSGLAALQTAASAPADGYTVLVAGDELDANLLTVTNSSTKMSDFYPLMTVTTDVLAVFVPVNSPYKTVSDLIAAAKSGKKINLGFSGPKSTNDLVARLLKKDTALGSNFNEVAFSGGSALRTAVAGGHVDAGISASQGVVAYKDQIRPIGFFSDTNPAPSVLNTTSINSQLNLTIPNIAFTVTLLTQKGTESKYPTRVKKLTDTLAATLADPTVVAAFDKGGFGAFLHPSDSAAAQSVIDSSVSTVQQYSSLFGS